MKHTVNILLKGICNLLKGICNPRLLVLLFVMTAGQAWGQGTTQRIITGTVTEGCSLGYYSDSGCTTAVNVNSVGTGTTIYIKATPDDSHTVTAMTVTAEATVSSIVATARRRTNAGSVNIGETIEVTTVSPGIFSFQMPTDDNINVTVSATFPEKGNITPVVSISGWTYGDTANAPSVSGNPGNGTVTYTYSDAQDGTYTNVVPTEAGTYWVKAAVAMTADYYAGVSAPVSFTIARKTVVVTITGHNSTVGWDGAEHSVSGYDFTADTNLYTESYFTFSGTAQATRTDVGTTVMGLTAAQFENTNANFDVTFNVTDGWLTVKILVTVTFNANGHGAAPAAQHIEPGSTATAPVDPIADGYTFGGWYTTAVCTGDAYDFDNTVVNDNLTLYAKWTVTVYTITYNGVDNATFESANPTSYTILSPAITLNNPIRENRVFVGWTGTGLNTPSMAVTIPTGSTGDRTYTAKWVSDIYCLAYSETTQTFDVFSPEDHTEVTSETTTMSDGWYAVTGDVTISSRIEVTGTVHLILCDGKTLTAPKGIHVPSGVTLNIYSQNAGTGQVTISNVDFSYAGIGGNNDENGGSIAIHGGIVTTTGGSVAAGIGGGRNKAGGSVAVYGGTVTANGGTYGAGIGGGQRGAGCSSVVIYGGTVNAKGSESSAGIGGGREGSGGSSVVITGGTVNATGGSNPDYPNYNGAGIGGGYKGAGCNSVTITGGIVTAQSGDEGQAIGHGDRSSESGGLTLGYTKVYASNGAAFPVATENRVSTCQSTYAKLMPCTQHQWVDNTCAWCGATCHGVVYGRNNATGGTAPIDATNYTDGQTVTVLGNTGNLERTGYTFTGWNTKADGSGTDYAASDAFPFSGDVTLYAKWAPITYTISYNLNDGQLASPNPTSYTADDEDITLVNPTLDGYTFGGWTGTGLEGPTVTVTIAKGSTGDRAYTAIWRPIVEYVAYNTTTQKFDALTAPAYLVVTSETTEIGNNWYVVNSDVTISSRINATGTVNLILCDGKTLTASKGLHVPSGVTLNIYGQNAGTGQITISRVDNKNAGIGGNNNEDGGSVAIHGSVVTTKGGSNAAGIGGGSSGHGGSFTIHGGTITAIGDYAAGIGGGNNGNGGTVIITGGTVTATGGTSGAGIGGGYYGGGGAVTITGGTVIAKAGNSDAQAIGRGNGTKGSGTLTLGDMSVYANADATDPVATDSRESTCRTTYAKLIACAEHQWVNNTCIWCGATCHGVVYGRNNATGGTAPIDATIYTDGQTVTVLGNTGNLERTGYTFAGWNTKADGSGINYAASDAFTFSGDVTLYAKWAIITYTISYDLNDGQLASANPTSYTVDDEDITLVNPTRDGLAFGGWTGTGLEGPTLTVTIAKGSTGNREYTANWQPVLEYCAYNTMTQEFETSTAPAYIVVTSSTTTMNNGWYAVNSNVTVNNRIEVIGTVNLILCDGATLTVPKGLHVPSGVTLNIYGQISGTGVLSATNVDRSQAAIGGNSQEKTNTGNVTIHGGNITATSSYDAAGIGGGDYGGNGGNVTIHGGIVTATGKNNAAGIGGGYNGNGGTVTITGGTVTATGGTSGGAGIGGAWTKAGGAVTITGGTVIAKAGNSNAQAIGHGKDSSESGELTLGGMKVYDSADATDPVASDNRESTCRSTYAKLMLCTQHNNSHGVCAWCGAENQLILANNADNSDAISQVAGDGISYDVTLSDRTLFKDGYWNTLCLPFGLSAFEGSPLEGATVKTLKSTDFSDGTLTLTFSEDLNAIEAGKPYIVKWTTPAADIVNPVFTGVTISNTKANVSTDYVDFVGTYSPVNIYTAENTNLYLGEGNTLYYPTASDFKVNACRAYFQLKNGLTAGDPTDPNATVRAFMLDFGDEESQGISDAPRLNDKGQMINDKEADAWYDLSGRKLSGVGAGPVPARLPKGVYINNGRKVVIK